MHSFDTPFAGVPFAPMPMMNCVTGMGLFATLAERDGRGFARKGKHISELVTCLRCPSLPHPRYSAVTADTTCTGCPRTAVPSAGGHSIPPIARATLSGRVRTGFGDGLVALSLP